MSGSAGGLRIGLAFACAFFLSYVFRTVNAVVAPELTRELALAPSALGLISSAYFFAFALMQLPVGTWLDRFGPRRTEACLLLLAAAGAVVFGAAQTKTGLAIGRALLGCGVAACLMASLKGISLFYPAQRQASVTSWIMIAGSLGALVATTPAEWFIQHFAWRNLFFLGGVLFALIAGLLWWQVPDPPPDALTVVPLAEQWRGIADVVRARRFWWIAPLTASGMGGFMAMQSLWAVPWMMTVEGLSRAAAAQRLLWMTTAILLTYLALGLGSQRALRHGIRAAHWFGAGFVLHVAAGALITANIQVLPAALWCLFGVGSAVNVLAFNVLVEPLPKNLVGRASTALNLMLFAGTFTAQWGLGVVAEYAGRWGSLAPAPAMRFALALLVAVQFCALLWFFAGWRVHTPSPPAASNPPN
jgi:sugar phosphate permease